VPTFSKVHVLGRPLHPLLVHFPLALLGMSFVFDVLSLALGAPMVEAARYNVLAGLVAAIPAAATGARDFVRLLPRRSAIRRIGRFHIALNLCALGLFAIGLAERWQERGAQVTPRWPFVLSALGVALLGISGYLGGVMVFNQQRDLDEWRRPPATR
jgi:uncharacterized membrane protein